jgi:hypothetical protein
VRLAQRSQAVVECILLPEEAAKSTDHHPCSAECAKPSEYLRLRFVEWQRVLEAACWFAHRRSRAAPMPLQSAHGVFQQRYVYM